LLVTRCPFLFKKKRKNIFIFLNKIIEICKKSKVGQVVRSSWFSPTSWTIGFRLVSDAILRIFWEFLGN
jgi:hypothetical protein